MRLNEFTEPRSTTLLNEEEKSDTQSISELMGLDNLPGFGNTVIASQADFFDMSGSTYPEGVGPEFFETNSYSIGDEPGNLAPSIANLYRDWDRTGRNGVIQPQTIEQWAEDTGATLSYGYDMYGNPMSYDNNPVVIDYMWKMAGETWDWLGKGVVGGGAEASDWVSRKMGFISDGNPGLRGMVNPFVEFAGRVADSNYALMDQDARDKLKDAENGVTEIDDIWNVVTGNSKVTGAGLGLMIAGELPSELAAASALSLKTAGLLIAGGMNMAEAMGYAGISMDERVNEMWDDGQLEGTEVLRIAQDFFPEDLDSQRGFIADQAKNSQLMNIGLVAGVADTIGDKLAWRGVSGGRITNYIKNLTMGSILDAAGESLEQFLENLGMYKGTGIKGDLSAGVVNAGYQGIVVGAGTSVVGQTASRAGDGLNYIRDAVRANPDAVEQLMNGRNLTRAQINDSIKEQFGPDATITAVFDSVPVQGELNRRQRRQLADDGFITMPNGNRVTQGQIDYVSDRDNRRTFAMLQFAKPNTAGGGQNLNFATAENLEIAARALDIDTSKFDLTTQDDLEKLAEQVSTEVNQKVDIDSAILSIAPVDTPNWSGLSDTQKMQLLNRGWTETGPGQRFELEEVARHSIEQDGGDSLPDASFFNNLRTEINGPTAPLDGGIEPGTTTGGPSKLAQRKADDLAMSVPLDAPETLNVENLAVQRNTILTQTEIEVPKTPSEDISRASQVYNATIRITQGDMDPAAIEAMLDKLEENSPGIRDAILNGNEISDFGKNDDDNNEYKPPERPVPGEMETLPNTSLTSFDSTGGPRPPTGTEIELDGVKHRFLGRMWAVVKADGTLGSTGAVNSATQRQLSNMAISQSPVQPSTTGGDASGDPSDTSTADFTPQSTGPIRLTNPNIDGTSNIDTTAPPSSDASGELDATDTAQTGSGETDATNADSEVKEPEAEPEVFDPSAETPIDGQFADVEVPQSVKDEYADVLATQNGIKIMKFLDSLSPEQAGSLRVNTPGQDAATITTPPSDASGDPSDTSTADFTPTDASGDPSDTSTVDFTPTDASGDPSDTSTADFTPPSDASGDPSDTSTADFTPPSDASGDPSDTGTTGTTGDNTIIDPRVDQIAVDAENKRQELFRQAQQRIRDADQAAADARVELNPISTDGPQGPKIELPPSQQGGKDDSDIPRTGPIQLRNPNIDGDTTTATPPSDASGELDATDTAKTGTIVTSPSDTDTTGDDQNAPDNDITKAQKQAALDAQTQANIANTAVANTTVANTTVTTPVAVATDTTGNKKIRRAGGMLGKPKPQKSASMMKFTPINIRDPLNLKRFG